MRSSATFHNTVGARGDNLKAYEARAGSQEITILQHFKANPGRMFTPSEVHKKLFDPYLVPLTSVRRAITNLTTTGELRKTDIKVTGPYGIPEHCWYLPRQFRVETETETETETEYKLKAQLKLF